MSGKSIATFTQSAQLPAHLQQGAGLGNENVTADSLMLPSIDLIHPLSPQKQKSSPKYIEGAEDGKLFNSMTGELYDQVFLINLMFTRQVSVFKDRKFGGGFAGAFEDEAQAREYIREQNLDEKQYTFNETGVHKCLMLDEKGFPKSPIILYMGRSKVRVSNAWNTQIQLMNQGADRFATVWVLSSQTETNGQGQPFHNFKIDFAGFANEDLYLEAKKNYFAMKGLPMPDNAAA